MGLDEFITTLASTGVIGLVKRFLARRRESRKKLQPPEPPTKQEQVRELITAIRLYVQANKTNTRNVFTAEELASALNTDTALIELAISELIAQGNAKPAGSGYVFFF